MSECPEYDRLSKEVEGILADLAQTTTLQVEVFRSKNDQHFMRLDKQLELLVGYKERAIGGLRQHVKEHKCHPSIEPESEATNSDGR